MFLERINAVIPMLEEAGFQIASVEERPDVFGNACVVLRSQSLAVRFIFDRGQFFADVRLAEERGRWFALHEILSCASLDHSIASPREAADAILINAREIVSLIAAQVRDPQ